MPRSAGPPTVRLRRLAAELRALRAEAELTREQVEEQSGINQATLWRLEKGQARPHTGTLETLFELYGVENTRRAGLIELARGAKSPGWIRQYPHYSDAISDGYARRVQVRLQRQTILSRDLPERDPLEFWAVLDEAALHREVGGLDVMRAQLGRLLELGELPNVTLQVIPFDRGHYRGMDNSFSRLRFGSGTPDIVHVEGLAGDLFLESEAEVDRFGLVFDHLRATALSPRDSCALIATMMRG